MIVAHENATGIILRGDPGDFQDGEVIVVSRVQQRTVYETVERVAIVEPRPAGELGVAAWTPQWLRGEGWDGAVDYLLRWANDDPGMQRDSRRVQLGGVVHHELEREGGVES